MVDLIADARDHTHFALLTAKLSPRQPQIAIGAGRDLVSQAARVTRLAGIDAQILKGRGLYCLTL